MIPLSVPNISGNEWKYIKECLDTNWVSSVGAYVNKFEAAVAAFTGAKYAVATSNGTTGLHISLQVADVKRNDFVLVSNITFVASVNSITYVGAEPMLVDVCPDTWEMDMDLLGNFLERETKIEKGNCIHKKSKRRIKAIMPVHILGNMCDVDKLMKLSKKFKLTIVEDSTEALGSYYHGQHAGTFGKIGCLSFNGNKIITTGGGGVIITNDEKLAKHAKHLTTQAKSDPFEYAHDEIGYNYRLVNILSAMGVAQMEQLPKFLKRKKEIVSKYKAAFKEITGIGFQELTDGATPNNWLVTIRVPDKKGLLDELKKNEIEARPLWVPMNRLPMYRKNIFVSEKNYSRKIYDQCVSLPSSSGITDKELDIVIATVKKFFRK